MAFRCPQCFSPASLQIIRSIELPNDRHWDEISLQAIRCSVCKFCGLAVYSELVSGAETDSWQHVGYWDSYDAFQSVITGLQGSQNRWKTAATLARSRAVSQEKLEFMIRDSMQLLFIQSVTFDTVLDLVNHSKLRMCSQESKMGLPVVIEQ